MEELNLSTPALLFSAVSLILLAYTNRFLSYAQLVRTLKEQYVQKHSEVTAAQIDNLRRRLYLTRSMQVLGISSLFLCVITMFLIYIGFHTTAVYVFGIAAWYIQPVSLRNHNVSDLYRISYNSSVCIRHSTAIAYSITRYFNLGDTHIRKGS